ncbi:hypothetical protein RFI_30426 [Reticulomyxa filosa]|uniref:Uncharacterized protein n=1 Tax=Reticulomyxa filosa TaxID=46433 RepID=X6M052_RETFI|nr:hypothetical protein RFI_30426 [Reticulomyxa filosa]|eukprot:ETO06966.1 hypothetical protein RFI_30426 [Reticulomyxa filosa]
MISLRLLSFVFFSQVTFWSGVNADYSVALANRMCEFALASYCCGNLGHGVATWTCDVKTLKKKKKKRKICLGACKEQPQITNVTVFSSDFDRDANGFVAYDPTIPCIVIAFAGTDPLSIEDWLDDLDAVKTPYPACAAQGCEVHKGIIQKKKKKKKKKKMKGVYKNIWPNQ